MDSEITDYLQPATPAKRIDSTVLQTLHDAESKALHYYIKHVRHCAGESASCHIVTWNYYTAKERYAKALRQVFG